MHENAGQTASRSSSREGLNKADNNSLLPANKKELEENGSSSGQTAPTTNHARSLG
jgi:hypothetical protein